MQSKHNTMRLFLFVFISFLCVNTLNAQKTKEQRQAEGDARKNGEETEQTKGSELAEEVEPLYITLNLIDKPLSFSERQFATINIGEKKARNLKGNNGYLYFNSETHAINYIASFGWEVISQKTDNSSSFTIKKYLFKRAENGKIPPTI